MPGGDIRISPIETESLIFNIQRFSLHDGPGIRTIIFLKGCPLRCLWCFNPESWQNDVGIMEFKERCIACGRCFDVCPVEAIDKKSWFINRKLCNSCLHCVEICPTNARQKVGKIVKVSEIMEEIEKDTPFYRNSHGGVTVSGGEPLLQPLFTGNVLRECKKRFISTALETTGYAPWRTLNNLLHWVDHLLYDVKHIDSAVHRRLTGVPNELILDNLKRCVEKGKRMAIRIPIIPGCNDSPENIEDVCIFLKKPGGIEEIHLLPYHTPSSKYQRLGRDYPLKHMVPPQNDKMVALRKLVLSYGFRAKIGG